MLRPQLGPQLQSPAQGSATVAATDLLAGKEIEAAGSGNSRRTRLPAKPAENAELLKAAAKAARLRRTRMPRQRRPWRFTAASKRCSPSSKRSMGSQGLGGAVQVELETALRVLATPPASDGEPALLIHRPGPTQGFAEGRRRCEPGRRQIDRRQRTLDRAQRASRRDSRGQSPAAGRGEY